MTNQPNQEFILSHASLLDDQALANVANEGTPRIENVAPLKHENEVVTYVDEVNPLILNHPRPKVRHDYHQLHHKGIVKSAKFISHGIKTPKTFEEAIKGPQSKE